MVTRGFGGRQPPRDIANRLPPGQFVTEDFPVLSAGPNPRISMDDWRFTLKVRAKPVAEWSWAEFNALPQTRMTRDIHCVTAWSKFDTAWEGVLVDDILAEAGIEPATAFMLAHSYDGYTTNVPTARKDARRHLHTVVVLVATSASSHTLLRRVTVIIWMPGPSGRGHNRFLPLHLNTAAVSEALRPSNGHL
jgi:DMSO/TMAO reductase YedYZ molybdopterin-dependent catalytic subunit